jgi:hypothetical protein
MFDQSLTSSQVCSFDLVRDCNFVNLFSAMSDNYTDPVTI